MGNLRACSAVAMLALAACGSDHAQPDASIKIIDSPMPDAKVFEDAPPPMFDFSCMGNTAPTTATANITLSGTVQRAYFNGTQPAIMALDGATVKACKAGAANCSGPNQIGTTQTTAGGGNFSIGPIATSMMPLDGYLDMQASMSRTTFVYPPAPATADLGMIPVLTFDPQLVGFLSNVGCPQNDNTNGIAILAITDCANAPIDDTANTVLSVKQGGTEVTGVDVLDLGQLQAQLAGTYFVCNIPENATTTVGASYKGMALRGHDVQIVKATTTATIISPGY